MSRIALSTLVSVAAGPLVVGQPTSQASKGAQSQTDGETTPALADPAVGRGVLLNTNVSSVVSVETTEQNKTKPIMLVDELGPTTVISPTGEEMVVDLFRKTKFVCGTDETGLDEQVLREIMDNHDKIMAEQEIVVVNTPQKKVGLDVIFNVGGNIPAGAIEALQFAEQVIESTFDDPSTIVVSFSFQPLPLGIIGSAGSADILPAYSVVRNSLALNNDGDDFIQEFLPEGTIPMIYNFNNLNNITNENLVDLNTAAAKAIGFQTGGSDVNITLSTQFNFDFDPSNGISGFQTSFVDVVIHEVGHAQGFTSNADINGTNPTILDLFRFALDDLGLDLNPDTQEEFTTTPRIVDFNAPDNDRVIVDVIASSYRMEDGDPDQASHFREQGNNIGIMDPSIAGGQTFFDRGFYSEADLIMFDAIGYDVSTLSQPFFNVQPAGVSGCAEDVGGTITLNASAGGGQLSYQWFKDQQPIDGETNVFLILGELAPEDSGAYFVRASNPLGSTDSEIAEIDIQQLEFTVEPQSVTVVEGEDATFTFETNFPTFLQFWTFTDPFATIQIGGETLTIEDVPLSLDGSQISIDVRSSTCGELLSIVTLNVVPATADPCLADVNGDGTLSFDDFSAWLTAFLNEDPAADQNGDEKLAGDDFNAFINNFLSGCS
ncbi:MAG: NF038122 family metalloprotease [Planctomycetota bacterium]